MTLSIPSTSREAEKLTGKNVISASVRAVILATEIAVQVLTVPAVAVTAMSSGNGVGEKVLSGLGAPAKLKKLISDIPKDIEHADMIVSTVEEVENLKNDENLSWFGKIREAKRIADERLPKIIETLKELGSSEFEHMKDLRQGMYNFQNVPKETLASMLIVLAVYSLFAFILKTLRLGDRDSIPDSVRKKFYYFITGKQSLETQIRQICGENASEEEILEFLKNGIEAYNNKKGE